MPGDFDAATERIYRATGYLTSEQAPILKMAERLLGDGSIRTAPRGVLSTWGSMARVGTSWRIYLAADCPASRLNFVAAHELSHWVLGLGATEEDCDRLAAALVLPRSAFLSRCRLAPSLAACRRFGVDQSCAWLRYGEATGTPLALVTPTSIRLRGAAYLWPAEPIMRELGEGGERRGFGRFGFEMTEHGPCYALSGVFVAPLRDIVDTGMRRDPR